MTNQMGSEDQPQRQQFAISRQLPKSTLKWHETIRWPTIPIVQQHGLTCCNGGGIRSNSLDLGQDQNRQGDKQRSKELISIHTTKSKTNLSACVRSRRTHVDRPLKAKFNIRSLCAVIAWQHAFSRTIYKTCKLLVHVCMCNQEASNPRLHVIHGAMRDDVRSVQADQSQDIEVLHEQRHSMHAD